MLMTLKEPIVLQPKLHGFGQLDLKSGNHLAPQFFQDFSGFTCTPGICFAGLGSSSSSLQFLIPDAAIWMSSSVILSAFREEQPPFNIPVTVHFIAENVHQPLYV